MITRSLSAVRLRPGINRPAHAIVICLPTSATNKSASSVFAARRTEDVCCGVSNKSGRSERDRLRCRASSTIKRTARNEEITSAYICHASCRGVRCIMRRRRSRKCRRFFSNQPGLEHAGPRNNNRLQPGESLGCLVREWESHLDFGPGHTDVATFSGHGQHRRLGASVHCQHPARRSFRSDRAGRQRNGDGFRCWERREWQIRCVHLCQPERLDLRLEWDPAHPSIHPNVRRRRELHRASPSIRPTPNCSPPTTRAAPSTRSTIRSN